MFTSGLAPFTALSCPHKNGENGEKYNELTMYNENVLIGHDKATLPSMLYIVIMSP